MRQHLGREAGGALDPIGDVAGGREQPLRLAERDPVQALDRAPQRPVPRFFGELPQIGSVELVRLAELVQHPDPLVRVPDDVRGELRREHEVDRPPVRLAQVEQAPEEGLVEHTRARIPLERDGDELGLVLARPQLLDERVRHDLGPAAHERNLRRADCDSHDRCFNSASSCATRASRSSISRSAAALNERWSYATGSTYQRISLRSTAFAGVPRPPRTPGRKRRLRSAETGQSRSASARAALRSSALPLSPGRRARAPHLLLQLLEERREVGRLPSHRTIVPGRLAKIAVAAAMLVRGRTGSAMPSYRTTEDAASGEHAAG